MDHRNPRNRRRREAGLPSREEILDFIGTSQEPAGKREIARAFGLAGPEKIALKALLRDMADEGLIDSSRARAFHRMGGVPRVTVLRVVEAEGGEVVAVPEIWHGEGLPVPRLRVMERGRRSALAIGDRILARTEEAGAGLVAHPMKKLARGQELALGVLVVEPDGRAFLQPVDKRERRMTPVSDTAGAEAGQLVHAELEGSGARVRARVTEVLGDPLAPRSFSLIAIHKHGIPVAFAQEALDEAQAAAALPLSHDRREDLTHLPIIAIDPADARDHDDAVWAAPDDDPANPGGYRAIVAIADVSFYVRAGGALDRAARSRGNSVYFPDRVVPMLPEILSADVCSLTEGSERAAMACHLVIDARGKVTGWRFARARVRIARTIAYEDAQAQFDAGETPLAREVLAPLWACWRLLARARDARAPLALDLPERRVALDAAGRIAEVGMRERLDAHRLVEDFMIAANVAAARALEAKKAPVVYRVHEVPSREKLVALKDYLETLGLKLALGQVIAPATFNRLIAMVEDETLRPLVMEQVLRSQTQAYYGPRNEGHFGLALASYAHFTSPIRRYADLLVHRSLVDAHGLEQPRPDDRLLPARSGLGDEDAKSLDRVCEAISATERRAMEAERETMDRYVAAWLADRVGEVFPARITGVRNFGFFATTETVGGDGIVPVSTLGSEYFRYDEAAQALVGEHSGLRFGVGQRLDLRLLEADPVSGALRFGLADGRGDDGREAGGDGPPRRGRGAPRPVTTMRRGRPANIRHQGRRR